jgi:CRP-like cAMP-binding protein
MPVGALVRAGDSSRRLGMFGQRKKAVAAGEDPTGLASRLATVAFFDGFTDDELNRVAQLADEVAAQAGAVIVDQGRVGQECFVVLEGEASVYVAGEHVATSGPGSMIGEMALVEHRPRNATVVADTEMVLLAFDTPAFKTLLSEMPKANDRVMEILAARLRVR